MSKPLLATLAILVALPVLVSAQSLPVTGSVLLSPLANGTVAGLAYTDDDILEFDYETAQWSILFDGSEFGITSDINAITLSSDGSLLFSIARDSTVPGLGQVDESDLIRFIPDTSGDFTSGALEIYFDGSDVGLTTSSEDITAVSEDAVGNLLISVRGRFAADGLVAGDEDLLLFEITETGANTSGSWSLYMDGSAIGLSTTAENIWGVSAVEDGIALTTQGTFRVSDVRGGKMDIFECTLLGSAPVTCDFELFSKYPGSVLNRSINAIHINEPGDSIQNPTPPTAAADSYQGIKELALTISAAEGLLANDQSFELQNTWVMLESDVAHGSLTIQPNGAFDYLPNAGFTGEDSFTYKAVNSAGVSNVVTVELVVTQPPEEPVLNRILVSTLANGSVDGMVFTDDDILSFDLTTGEWSLLFDGSLFGISTDINALTIDANGSLLFSLAAPASIAGLGLVDDSDLVRFTPDVAGAYSQGTLELYFDGSDVGLTSAGEDITGVAIDGEENLLISVRGTFSSDGLSARDEDIVLFEPTQIGETTSGSWHLYLDGSVVDLKSTAENIWGIGISSNNLILNTLGAFSVPDASGTRSDLLICDQAGSLPVDCAFALQPDFPGASLGKTINALHADLSVDGVEPPPPAAPIAVADNYTTTEGFPLQVDAENGVLSNDMEITPQTTAVELTSSANGTLLLSSDGSFSYDPQPAFAGSDSFTYQATNADGTSESATVTIVVLEDTDGGSGAFVTHLNFDNGEGDPVDSSGAGNSATLLGAQYSTETADGSLYSLLFDGVDDEVSLGTQANTGDEITLAAWVNASSFAGNAKDGRIISRASGLSATSHDYMLSTIALGSKVQFRFRVKVNGSTQTLIVTNSNSALVTGVWYHIAATFDGSTMRVYQDGVEVASKVVNGTVTSSEGVSTSIGSHPGGLRHWHGFIDDVRVLNTALSAQSIESLVAAGSGVLARDDSYSTAVDVPLVVNASGVLANDDDPDGLGLTAALVDEPLFGSLSFSDDGSFTYTPTSGFVGVDRFRYQSIQPSGIVKTASATLNVLDTSGPALVFNTGSVNFVKLVVDNTVDNAHYVGAADYNNDGLIDLIGTDYVDATVFLYDQQSDGTFVRRVLDESLAGAYPAHNGDIDQDGDTDILAGGYLSDTVALYINNGNGQFSKQAIDTAALGIHSMEIVDLDQDGDSDLVAALQDAGDIVWYENTGSLSFVKRTVDGLMSKAKRVSFADFDNDGDIDLTAAADGVNRVAWYENDGSQNFSRRIIDNNLEAAYFVHTDDMDGDGFSDILAAGKVGNQIVLYRNKMDGTFQKTILDSTARGARSTFAADVDGDGKLDAIGNALQADYIAWYKNNGDGTYTRNIVDSNADGAYGVLAHDVDGDGDQDLLLASRDDFSISVYYNNRLHELPLDTAGNVLFQTVHLEVKPLQGHPTASLIFTIINAPSRGDIALNGQALSELSTFSQADIDAGSVSYVRTDGTIETDQVLLSVGLIDSSSHALTTVLRFSFGN